MFSGNPAAFLQYTSQVAGGQDIEVSFDYKLIDVATGNPVTGDFGQIDLSYSVDNGSTWTVYDNIDQTDPPTTVSCSTHSQIIPLANVPMGSDFGWRLDITYNNTPLGAGGDYYLYIDDFKAVEQVGCIPPVNITVDPNSIGFDGATISWDDLNTPPAVSYEVVWCVSAGNPDVGTNPTCLPPLGGSTTVTGATSVSLTNLFDGTPYFVYIRANCASGDSAYIGPGATDPATFSTLYIGTDCNGPIEVNADPLNPVPSDLPYDHTSQTDLYGSEEYSGSPGAGCGANAGNLLNGYEVVYHYTTPQNDILTIDLTNLTGTNIGVFVYESCADIGNICIAGASTDTGGNLNINSLFVTQGEDYYIVIASTDATFNPFNSNYDLHIEGFDCATFTAPNGNATYSFVSGQTLDDFSYLSNVVTPTINGATLTWYTDASLTTTAPLSTGIADNDVFYVTQNINTCESAALMVTFNEFDCLSDLGGITSTQPGSVCDEGTVTLGATAATTDIYWYASATGGEVLATGPSFTTPEISQTTTYWATEVFLGAGEIPHQASPGPVTANSSSSDNYGLEFTAFGPFTIKDLKVFATGSGSSISLELRDAGGSLVLGPTILPINGGSVAVPMANTLSLDWDISASSYPATFYIIKTAGPSLMYDDNAEFPYKIATSGEVTGGGFNGIGDDYFYFYDWTIIGPSPLCESPRTQVVATVHPIIPISLDVLQSPVCLGSSTDLTVTTTNTDYTFELQWGNQSDTNFDANNTISISPTENTTYTVIATDTVTGCQTQSEIDVEVIGVPSPLTIAPESAVVCSGETIQLIAGGIGENFETGNTWTTVDNSSSNVAVWGLQQSPFGNAGITSNDNSQFFISKADLLGAGGDLDVELISPTFSLVSVTNASIRFYHNYRSHPSTVADVDISTDGGTTWTNLDSYTVNQGTASVFSFNEIDISNYVNYENVKIRFHYHGGWGWWWAIDNIVISRDYFGEVTWSPATNLYFDPSASVPYDGTTDAPTIYYQDSSGQTQNATYTASLNVSTCGNVSASINVTSQFTQPPTAAAAQTLNEGELVSDLDVTGQNLSWYSDEFGLVSIPDSSLLVDGTTYYVSQTVNGCESALTAITVTLITPSDNCPAPTNPVLENTTSTTATISWTLPQDPNGEIEHYYKINELPGGNTVFEGQILLGTALINITGLTPQTDYEFVIYSICDELEGVTSEIAGPLALTTLRTNDINFNSLVYYPNPTQGQLWISNAVSIDRVEVYDISGKKLLEKEPGALELEIDFSNFSQGVYFVKITAGKAVKIVRTIKE
jgi:hypothetical protein